jgi:hypothetical protein
MAADQELQAMGTVLSALQELNPDERRRVLQWASQKLAVDVPIAAQKPESKAGGAGQWKLSTDTIATIVGASSGPDLVIAAAAHLHFAEGKSTFTRRELTSEMRSAPSHYKATFLNNLSSYLAGLTRADRLRLSGTDIYALSNRERQNLEAKLAAAE